jgi:hypothetical protein
MNVSVPIGVPDEADTVALNATADPATTGFCDEATVVVVAAAVGVVLHALGVSSQSLPQPTATIVIETASKASRTAE